MIRGQADLAALAICRVSAGLPAVSWRIDLIWQGLQVGSWWDTVLRPVNGSAWDSNLWVSVGQGVPGWQLEVPGGAERLACIQDGLAASL